MNVPPDVAARLTLWEYEALLHNWNKIHDPDGDLAEIDTDDMEMRIQHLKDNPEMLK